MMKFVFAGDSVPNTVVTFFTVGVTVTDTILLESQIKMLLI